MGDYAQGLLAEFQRYADGLLTGFTGRDWLVERVRAWQENPAAKPFLLVQGTAGIGKSAFAAYLWRTKKMVAAAHFCIAGRGGTTEPLTFVEVISDQLAGAVPGFAEARRRILDGYARQTVNIQSEVQAGNVAPGGQVTGVAVRINLRGIPVEQAFDLIVRRPLRKVSQANDLPPVLILVDALDEALTYQESPNIVNLLQKSGDLPSQVRWVLTSRPEPKVTQALTGLPVEILDAADPLHQDDVRQYLRNRLGELAPTARAWGMAGETLVDLLGQKSEWNFLYLLGIWSDLAKGRISSPDQLPVGLDDYYRYLLDTRVGAEAWAEWGADLMEVLLALQEPVDLETLCVFLGWELRLTLQRLNRVTQMLSPALLQEGRYYRHHWSLAEFLGDRKRAAAWWCDLKRGHRQIAKRLLDSWGGLEAGLPGLRHIQQTEYGIRHIVTHVLAGEQYEQAYHLLTDFDYLEARCRATSPYDLEADYRRALAAWPQADAEQRAVLAALEERVRLEASRLAQAPEWLFPALYNHLRWRDAPDGPLYRLCEEAARHRTGYLRSRLDPRPEPPPWLLSLEGHTEVNAVAVSPDGRFIVSGSNDRTVKVWDAESGRLLRSLEGHTRVVNAVAVSPDGRTIVSGSSDRTVRAWDLESGASRVLFWNDAAIFSLALSAEGRTLACGDAVGRVWIFDWMR